METLKKGGKAMRIILIIIAALLLSNCTSSYVKNKKIISSPNDLQKFTNVWCEKSPIFYR